jgi:hypothetical protein
MHSRAAVAFMIVAHESSTHSLVELIKRKLIKYELVELFRNSCPQQQ